MKPPIFVSYSSTDRPFVVRLVSDLSALGLTTWWDHTDLSVGQHIHREINDRISQAGHFCLVLTPRAMESRWVQHELDLARAREMKLKQAFILPLLLEAGDYPLDLEGKKHANFTMSYEAGFQQLVDVVSPPLDPDLIAALFSGDALTVEAAARRIPTSGTAVYLVKIQECFYSEDPVHGPRHRLSALIAMHTLQQPEFIPMLLSAARDESAAVRRQAAVYLSKLTTPAAKAALIELREDRTQTVRDVVKDALRRLGM